MVSQVPREPNQSNVAVRRGSRMRNPAQKSENVKLEVSGTRSQAARSALLTVLRQNADPGQVEERSPQ